MGFCNCSMFFCVLLRDHSNFEIIMKGKRELVAFLILSSLCLVILVWLFCAVCLQFVIVIFLSGSELFFDTYTSTNIL